MSVDRDEAANGLGRARTTQIRRDLERAGVAFSPAGGATLDVRFECNGAGAAAARQLRRQAFDVLANGLALSVSITTATPEELGHICRLLRSAADDAGVPATNIELVASSPQLLPGLLPRLRARLLGDGVVHILAGEGLLQPAAGRGKRADRCWRQLWRARRSTSLRLAWASDVRPACALLAAEPVRTVLPVSGLQAPTGSAWVPMRIDLRDFCGPSGALAVNAFEQALRAAVEAGEALHDLLAWPTARMRHDSWLNRRLAIGIAGIGDLAARRGQDPGSFRTLEDLDAMLGWVRDILRSQSRTLARQARAVPALERSDPCRSLPGAQRRNDWDSRWRDALAATGVRHRNLLALSPWALFPQGPAADSRYGNLVPVMRHADVCAAGEAPGLARWNFNEFKDFHKRVFAVLQQRET